MAKVKEKKEVKYYNSDELFARHYNFNFICGDRFGGKSTNIQAKIIKRCIKYTKKNGKLKEDSATDIEKAKKEVVKNAIKGQSRWQFAVFVRYDKDIKALCETYFDNTMMMWYPDYELIYEKRKFFLRKKNTKEKILVGYGFALNQATKLKSTSYPFIQYIIMEEFLNIENKYIKSQADPELEPRLLVSAFQSIARGNGKQFRDDVRVICISNNYYLNNPYFRYFNLIDRIVKSPFQRFYEQRENDPENDKIPCIVEMTHNDLKTIGKGDIDKGGKFVEMSHQIKYVKDVNIDIKNVLMQLTFDSKKYLNIVQYNESLLLYEYDSKIKNIPTYTCSEMKKAGHWYIDEFWRKDSSDTLIAKFDRNDLYFDKLDSYITLYNIINYSAGH